MDYLRIRSELLSSIQILIDTALSKLEFDRHMLGKITTDLTGGIYTVDINGESYNIKAKSGDTYSINDVVWVLYINGNSSQKIIDFKVP